MTRRRFYAPPADFSEERTRVVLSADEARHLRDVLRLHEGDEVYVFNGAGAEFLCSVERIDRRTTIDLLVQHEIEPARPESPLDLTLAVALLKGEKFDLVVQKATELGVARIVPLMTRRADVRLREERGDAGSDKRTNRLTRLALEAAKQSGRALVPQIDSPVRFDSFVEENSSAETFFFSERDGVCLRESTNDSRPSSLIAVIGPEGGWDDKEIETARAAGWRIITLGGRIMRAETAAIAITALLQHLFGDLS